MSLIPAPCNYILGLLHGLRHTKEALMICVILQNEFVGCISHFMGHTGLSLAKSVYVICRGMRVVVNEARYFDSMQPFIHGI